MNRKPYTPADLRELAKANGANWAGEVRAALHFSADLIAAADAVRVDHEAALAAAVAAAYEDAAKVAVTTGGYRSVDIAQAIRARGATHD